MAVTLSSTIRIQRTGVAEWTVYKSGLVAGVLTDTVAAGRLATGLVSNAASAERYGTDHAARTQSAVITLGAFSGTDSFKLTYLGTETAAFTRGTDATAAAIQAAMRTATGDNTLVCTGTTDAGPFTIVQSTTTTAFPLITVTTLSGCTSSTVTTVGGTSSGATITQTA